MGLGVLGRGVKVANFLAKYGAQLIITDLKEAEYLKSSLSKLKKYKNIKYTLGGHKLGDFKNKDMIIKAAGVPLDSVYISEARKNKIPVEMDASLFAKLSKSTIIGVTGTRGKSTTTYLIYEILKRAGRKVFIGGNIRGQATLPLLDGLGKDNFVVLELDSWQLQGFGDAKISPHISVFTNFMSDHMNYYKNSMALYFNDKANIFKYQTKNDFLITGQGVFKAIEKYSKLHPRGKVIVSSVKNIPKKWHPKLKGRHNLENIAHAIKVAEILQINKNIIRKAVENFGSIEGRLELVKIHKGIKIYNDTNATTPDATLVGLRTLSKNKNIILIMGGADKNLDMSKLVKALPKYCKSVILLPSNGTDKIIKKIKIIKPKQVTNLKQSLAEALNSSKRGDCILFSPAFASFNMFRNEYDRGDKFIKLLKSL